MDHELEAGNDSQDDRDIAARMCGMAPSAGCGLSATAIASRHCLNSSIESKPTNDPEVGHC